MIQPDDMRMGLITAGKRMVLPRPGVPDLSSQLEELLVEVWRQEDFERQHPFTCAVIREASRSHVVSRTHLN